MGVFTFLLGLYSLSLKTGRKLNVNANFRLSTKTDALAEN